MGQSGCWCHLLEEGGERLEILIFFIIRLHCVCHLDCLLFFFF